MTSRMSCSTSTTVMPSRASRRMMAAISAVSIALQPAAGSSSRMSLGSLASARAISSRLSSAVGKTARRLLGHRSQADARERGHGRIPACSVLPPDRGQMQQVGEYARRLMTMAPDHDVFDDGHAEEDLQVLESPRQAPARQLFRRKRGHILAGQAHAALLRQVETGDHVEQRGLAGAVGSDDRKDDARRDRQVDVIDGVHAAEGDRQVFGGENGHARLAADAPASAGTMPARRKIIIAMTMRPSAMCS